MSQLPDIPAPSVQTLRRLLWKVLVREFYRQNAGFFLFFFLLFFGIVGPSQQLYYHYSLIRGILSAPSMLVLVFSLWLLYAIKCVRWITGLQNSADHAFLHMLPLLGKTMVFRLLLGIQAALYLPIILYAIAIIGVGFHEAAPLPSILIMLFVLSISLGSTFLYQHTLFHPDSRLYLSHQNKKMAIKKNIPYWSILMRGFLAQHKALLGGIKLFSCGILYLLLTAAGKGDYDIRMPFLLFSLALFGHGALIYQSRGMEEQQLLFYRGMPLSLVNRWLQYLVLYFLLLLPEMITMGWLIPDYIRIRDALGCMSAGYGTLLLLNSCLFIAPMRKNDFLKLCLGIFGILYFGVLSDTLILLSGVFFATAGSLFFRGYCRWKG